MIKINILNYYLSLIKKTLGHQRCTIVEMLYNDCIKDVTEQDKDKFIIISVNNKLEIKNASEQFKNKFAFYSPSITTGVDFSIEDKQDVFIYIHGQ